MSGAIYHHFESKAGLFDALMEEAQKLGGRAVQQAISAGGSFTEISRRVLLYSLGLVEEDNRFRQVMSHLLFHAPSRQWQAVGQSSLEQVAGFFRYGLAKGEVRPDLDPETADLVMDVLLAYVKETEAGLLLVTHDNTMAARCDSVFRLEDKMLKVEV